MRTSFLTLLLAVLVLPPAFLIYASAPAPTVGAPPAATADDAARVKNVYLRLRAATKGPAGGQPFGLSEADLNSILLFASRAVPRLRGRAAVAAGGVSVDGSLRLPTGQWLNGTATVAPAARGLVLSRLNIAGLEVPPGPVMPAVEAALNLFLGDGMGTLAVNGIRNTRIDGDTVTTELTLDRAQRKALAARTKDSVRAVSGFSTADDLRGYWLALNAAAEAGTIDPHGSFAAFLHHAVDRAATRATGTTARYEMQTALFAVAIMCGHPNLQFIVGTVVPKDLARKPSVCGAATLAGRRDLRQHFAVSAGLQVASDAGFAFAAGEYKELMDADRGGSGFSFDDIAADRAGIAVARALTQASPAAWRDARAALSEEPGMFPRVDDLPSLMPKAEFEQRFGGTDTPSYRAMIAEIDARIAALPVFSGL